MTEADKAAFGNLMISLGEAFSHPISKAKTAIFFRALIDIPFDRMKAAVDQAIATGKFYPFPVPAELRELAVGNASEADLAARAWEIVVETFRNGGYHDSVLFEDGAIGAALATLFGTWPEFYETLDDLSEEMTSAKRKEFIIAYRNARQGARSKQYLPGYFEITNIGLVGNWRVPEGRTTYKQYVYVVRLDGTGKRIQVQFAYATAQMVTPLAELLGAAPEPRTKLLPERTGTNEQ